MWYWIVGRLSSAPGWCDVCTASEVCDGESPLRLCDPHKMAPKMADLCLEERRWRRDSHKLRGWIFELWLCSSALISGLTLYRLQYITASAIFDYGILEVEGVPASDGTTTGRCRIDLAGVKARPATRFGSRKFVEMMSLSAFRMRGISDADCLASLSSATGVWLSEVCA